MAFNKEWRPTKPQELFISLPWTIKEAFFGGGMGGGKSDLLLILCLVLNLYKNPNFKQVFLRRTYQDLKKEIVPRSYNLYPKFGATFNASDMIWTFPREDQYGSGSISERRNSGARIYLGHCENDKDKYNYDSMEINLFTPDELQSFTEDIYRYISVKRVRTSDPTLPAIIRAAGMPGNIGHTFVKKRFVDPAPKGNTIIIGKAGIKRFYVHSDLRDNPHIDPDYRQSIDSLPEADKKAAYGDWNAFQGQVFDEFREFPYTDEPEFARHVIEPFEIPKYWPKIVVGDWGYAAKTWIGFLAISPNKRVYLYRELVFQKVKIEIWAQDLKHFVDEDDPKLIKFCKSAGQDRGQEHTIQQQISDALDREVELSSNTKGSRVAGKMLLHEYLRWKKKKTVPKAELVFDQEMAQRIYRLQGEEQLARYLEQFLPVEEEKNLPKLQIFNTCPEVIEAIKSCTYDENNKEDVAEFDGDDPYDGLRYGLDSVERYFIEAEVEFKKVQKTEEMLMKLDATKDWTAFYRQAELIDSRVGKLESVRRYRRH